VQSLSHAASSGSVLRLEAGGVHRFSQEVFHIPPMTKGKSMPPEIRLACLYCDTSECDGVSKIPNNWTDVQGVQSYAESREEIAADDPQRSPFEWYTHLGVCPACQKIYG